MNALHLLALGRGIQPGPQSQCACCGESPFGAGRAAADMLGATFSDHDALLAPGASHVCAGCVSVLAGRPGDDPPPLRTQHVLAVEGSPATYPGTPELAAILRDPPSRPFVLAVAESRKRHAALRAGVSSVTRVEVGLDDGRATILRAHVAVLDAIESMLATFSRADVLAGQYLPQSVARHGPARWEAAESVVTRYRPSRELRLLVLAARRPPVTTHEESPMHVPESERRAARIVSLVAEVSATRSRDGLAFWRSILPHRLARYSSLPLRDCVARLMVALQCDAVRSAPVLAELADLPGIDVEPVEHALRSRAPLVLVLAYEDMRARVDASRSARDNPLFAQEPT